MPRPDAGPVSGRLMPMLMSACAAEAISAAMAASRGRNAGMACLLYIFRLVQTSACRPAGELHADPVGWPRCSLCLLRANKLRPQLKAYRGCLVLRHPEWLIDLISHP